MTPGEKLRAIEENVRARLARFGFTEADVLKFRAYLRQGFDKQEALELLRANKHQEGNA